MVMVTLEDNMEWKWERNWKKRKRDENWLENFDCLCVEKMLMVVNYLFVDVKAMTGVQVVQNAASYQKKSSTSVAFPFGGCVQHLSFLSRFQPPSTSFFSLFPPSVHRPLCLVLLIVRYTRNSFLTVSSFLYHLFNIILHTKMLKVTIF